MTLRVIASPLGGSLLTHAAVRGSVPANWFPGPIGKKDRQMQEWVSRARSVSSEFATRNWLGDLSDAFGPATGIAAEKLSRAAEKGVVITTGQQPGLFGGPIYTLSKALSALSIADALERLIDIPVVAVFWAATDDSDFLEASKTIVPSGDTASVLKIGPDEAVAPHRPLATYPLKHLDSALAEFERACGSAPHPEILQAVRDCYANGSTVGGAYLALIRRLFEPLGIPVIDAAHIEVRAAGHATMVAALKKSGDVRDALALRETELGNAGFKPQVKHVASRSLVFRYSDAEKTRISVAESAKIGKAVREGDLSPNVLLRPIVERAILPVVAYVGGPAEVAYFAQVSAVANAIGAAQPAVVPRWSGTVIEPKIARILERHALRPDSFEDPHSLERTFARAAIPERYQKIISGLRAAVDSVAGKVDSDGDEHLSPKVIEGLHRDMLHRLERFERRSAAAVKRAGTQALHDIAVARAALYPLGERQERAVNFVALLARYGDEMLTGFKEQTRKHAESLL